MQLFESSQRKLLLSQDYNYVFDKRNGDFARWGKTLRDDPLYSPFGPEILDIEISAGGKCKARCPWCYKSNGDGPHINMGFEMFTSIFAKMPEMLTQIAFGITDLDANPDFLPIMLHTREHGVIPNFTTNGLGMTKDKALCYAKTCGAVAVSVYPHLGKEIAYRAVNMLREAGLEQTNIHLLYHSGNLPFVYEVLDDVRNGDVEPRAVVLLGLKPKGRAETGFAPLPQKNFTVLTRWCLNNKIPIGFDSCTAPKFNRALDEIGFPPAIKKMYLQQSESCESTLFSVYIDVFGNAWPCSFCEDVPGSEPVSVVTADDFLKDVWNSRPFDGFRTRLIAGADERGCRKCFVYPEING